MNNTTVNATQTPSVNPNNCNTIPCLFTTAELVVIAICSFAVILVAIVANTCTGIVLIASKNLRNISSISIISLTLADLLLSIFVAPFLIISVFFVNVWVFGAVMCKLYVFIQRVAVSAILLNLLVVSLERFLAVCFPFFLRMRQKLFLYAIILVWIVAVAMSTPDLFYMRLFMLKDGGEGCFSEQSVQSALFQSFHE
ncbi:neuropeptide Y receptor type 1-like, partial [Exaiptasia diaphana]|uniref:G-protein coupled receptors family 1 profile domain-containing protein n=1 Tax=Exaiptasia diaphana TaxID=2652724 RepID=A0A913WSY2_EXADI